MDERDDQVAIKLPRDTVSALATMLEHLVAVNLSQGLVLTPPEMEVLAARLRRALAEDHASGEGRQLTTEAQREQFYAARQHGGLCAACGKALAGDEPVYVEWFILDRTNYATGPVGPECASPEALRRAGDQEPVPCSGCGRPIYLGAYNLPAQRACSRYCTFVAGQASKTAQGPL